MKKIRIHNDIDVRWAVTTNGEDVSLEGRNLRLSIVNMFGRKEITDYTVVGNVVRFVFHGAEQRHTGLYVLVLQDITDGMRTVDKVQAFELVRHTIDQNGADDSNITTETVELTSDIIIGYDGKSAYDVAKANGFSGSETEWLASLKGDKGDAFRYEDFTPEQVSALRAPATDAAAEVARRLTALTDAENDMATAEEQREASVHNALEDIAEASGKAETATAAANTAAALANQKATAAQTATDACNTATTNANDATAAANTATTNANAATEAAVTAKQNADAATASATSATGLANTAAAGATTAKQNADTAAAGATTAKQNADTATAGATTAKQNADAATEAANTATAKADDTAAHPGYVDNDGYYHKWDATTRTYEKTDVSLKGAKGDAFAYGDFTSEQLEALRGPKGDAGYLHIVSHGTDDTTYTVPVNEMHVWGEVTQLNISLGANPYPSTVAEYAFKFTSGTTATMLTLPIDVRLPAGFVILPKHQYVMTVVFGMLEYWGTAL